MVIVTIGQITTGSSNRCYRIRRHRRCDRRRRCRHRRSDSRRDRHIVGNSGKHSAANIVDDNVAIVVVVIVVIVSPSSAFQQTAVEKQLRRTGLVHVAKHPRGKGRLLSGLVATAAGRSTGSAATATGTTAGSGLATDTAVATAVLIAGGGRRRRSVVLGNRRLQVFVLGQREHVHPVLLAVGQAAPDEALEWKGEGNKTRKTLAEEINKSCMCSNNVASVSPSSLFGFVGKPCLDICVAFVGPWSTKLAP